MEANYPMNLTCYYGENPDFEERMNTKKRILHFAIAAVCLLLVIFPSIVSFLPLGDILVRIAAGIGLIYFGVSAFFFTGHTYNKLSGGKIKKVAIKKFETPERGTVPYGDDDEKVLTMFANDDWEGLANEPEADDRPLQLYIDEDEVGKTFYLQLMRYFSSSDFRGVTEVKVISGPEYSKYYQVIKSIKST